MLHPIVHLRKKNLRDFFFAKKCTHTHTHTHTHTRTHKPVDAFLLIFAQLVNSVQEIIIYMENYYLYASQLTLSFWYSGSWLHGKLLFTWFTYRKLLCTREITIYTTASWRLPSDTRAVDCMGNYYLHGKLLFTHQPVDTFLLLIFAQVVRVVE